MISWFLLAAGLYLIAGAAFGIVHLSTCNNCFDRLTGDRCQPSKVEIVTYVLLSAVFAIPTLLLAFTLDIVEPCED